MDDYTPILTPEERAARRAQRAAARREKQRLRRRRMLLHTLPAAALGLVLVLTLSLWDRGQAEEARAADTDSPDAAQAAELRKASLLRPEAAVFTPRETAGTVQLGDEIYSRCAVVIDAQTQEILAERGAGEVLSPASMTKVLTLLVAAEHLEEADLDDTFPITIEITDYCFVNGCSVVGLDVGEAVPVRELLYGTILPSGADAALGLAFYVAGSHEAFVALMNEKLEELGLSDTAHFTNCVGLYDEAHKCTVSDMAVILEAAMDNDLCREVLGAHTYETAPTTDHPDGQVLSNWFLRRIEDKDTGGITVTGAKTGYVAESGNCAASCGEGPDGRRYLCVTADAPSSWQAIADHAALYKAYCSEAEAGGASSPSAPAAEGGITAQAPEI